MYNFETSLYEELINKYIEKKNEAMYDKLENRVMLLTEGPKMMEMRKKS